MVLSDLQSLNATFSDYTDAIIDAEPVSAYIPLVLRQTLTVSVVGATGGGTCHQGSDHWGICDGYCRLFCFELIV